MKKKLIVFASSLLIVSLLFVVKTQSVYAACECLRAAPPGAGTWYDNQGQSVPAEAYGLWTTTPVVAVNPADQEPICPPYVPPAVGNNAPVCGYAAGAVKQLMEGCECNVYTQGYVKTWFRVPTLGDLIGNIIRLMFFIAGLYALVLLLLGGFEWVSSGGEEKKLTSARGKIFNAIIGLVVMVAVLTLVIVLEQVVFGGKVCLGVSCPINTGDLSIIK
jgi:hypothetical protein